MLEFRRGFRLSGSGALPRVQAKEQGTMAEARETELRNAADGPDWGDELFDCALEFVDNPEPRCLCQLVLDTSRSMEGEPIAALNQGLQVLRDELLQVSLARKRVEVSIVTFGAAVEVVQDFVTADGFRPPVLAARGETPLGAGLLLALECLEARKACCRLHGVPYWRPWVFLITDGMPQGEPMETTREAIRRIKEAETERQLSFSAVGVEGANMKLLARIATRPPLRLHGLRFADLFTWLSASTARVAVDGDEQVGLPPVDWGTA
jgi:uncharacterized protein YegL